MNSDKAFDKLLLRQLSRLELSPERMPANKTEWDKFLNSINRAYIQCAQDRYLLERSLNLASKEMADLNEQIESAQSIAQLGYWNYDTVAGRIQWSKEIYKMFGLEYSDAVPSYDDIMKNFLHPDDWSELHFLIQKSLLTGSDYEREVRILNKKTNDYGWFYVKGHPDKFNQDHAVYELLSGIIRDITKEKDAEIKISELNQRLIASARQAGMVEVATSMLHNIGNVLNSVNVSTDLILEKFNITRLHQLKKAIEMIKDNLPNLTEYLATDPKGKLLPQFIDATLKMLEDEHIEIDKELKSISKYINHMKDIIKKQQKISKTTSAKDYLSINEIVNDAIQLSLGTNHQYDLKKLINIDSETKVLAEGYKVTQILINLIRNAAESFAKQCQSNNKIDIMVNQISQDLIEISVKDNGIGIDSENLKKLFTFGFTTKPNGHGFGLHNSALMAKEMGGSLCAESEGVGQGTAFKLLVPIEMRRANNDRAE